MIDAAHNRLIEDDSFSGWLASIGVLKLGDMWGVPQEWEQEKYAKDRGRPSNLRSTDRLEYVVAKG